MRLDRLGNRSGPWSTSLLSYTRKPTSRLEANNEDIALSMHLAIRSKISGRWEPLNGNYGIFFAAAIPPHSLPAKARSDSGGSSNLLPEDREDSENALSQYPALIPGRDLILKSLVDPFLVPLSDGTFLILATQVARGGSPDGSETDSFIGALSSDFLTYRRLPQTHIVGAEGVHRPRALPDANGFGCCLYWDDDQGRLCSARVEDSRRMGKVTDMTILEDRSDPRAQGDPMPQVQREVLERSSGIPDALPGNYVPIGEDLEKILLERFGRIFNTDCHIDPIQVTEESALRTILASPARLTYNDGSQSIRAVDWDRGQVDDLLASMTDGSLTSGDRRIIRGMVRQTTYPIPFARQRADPCIFRWSWRGQRIFMFVATEDEDGNCVDPRGGNTHMPLRISKTLSGLSDQSGGREREIDLLRRGDRNSEGRIMTGCFWAPEIHLIGGKLSILFMPCFDGELTNPDGTPNDRAGLPDMWTGTCHIMQLLQDKNGEDLDPSNPSNWDLPRPILCSDGSPLNPIQRISLDMTVFQDSGEWYYAWQQVGSIWIATFDPDRPDRLKGAPHQIIVPEFAWDNLIAEGPNVLIHEGRIFLLYSGSLVGIDYTTGLATAPAGVGADLTDPKVWSKLDYPLQKSGLYNGQWQLGTGHGMWSEDEDGNLLYVFHSAEYSNDQYLGRDSQVRRVHWSAEGMPILDMQAQEELDPTCASADLEVTIV